MFDKRRAMDFSDVKYRNVYHIKGDWNIQCIYGLLVVGTSLASFLQNIYASVLSKYSFLT